jgi:transcriptional regulator with GAF, ATPase, and Fis domain
MSVLETERLINSDTLLGYLPETSRSRLPVRVTSGTDGFEESDSGRNEREILYKVLFEMKGDLNNLKELVLGLIKNGGSLSVDDEIRVKRMFDEHSSSQHSASNFPIVFSGGDTPDNSIKVNDSQDIEPSLSLIDSEKELIKMALEKYNNRRKDAAEELGISERTLYRKIKEYSLK